MRPLNIETPEFGAKWGSLAGESSKNTVCVNIVNLAALRSAMEGTGCFAHVETIEDTSEAIFAAALDTDNSDVLVHVKVNPGNADITVKATSVSQCSSVLEKLVSLVQF